MITFLQITSSLPNLPRKKKKNLLQNSWHSKRNILQLESLPHLLQFLLYCLKPKLCNFMYYIIIINYQKINLILYLCVCMAKYPFIDLAGNYPKIWLFHWSFHKCKYFSKKKVLQKYPWLMIKRKFSQFINFMNIVEKVRPTHQFNCLISFLESGCIVLLYSTSNEYSRDCNSKVSLQRQTGLKCQLAYPLCYPQVPWFITSPARRQCLQE